MEDNPDSPVHVDISAPPGAGLDLRDPQVVVNLFDQAAEANLKAKRREGATVTLPARHHVLMTGDIHDHGLNLQRIVKMAALHEAKNRHVILHEIVHGPHFVNGRDLSVRTLARVATLKLQYPDQVHLMQANHELSQLGGEGISKDGINVVQAFDDGLEFLFVEGAGAVREAMLRFIRSLLLVVRLPNGIFCSHSVPSPRMLENFDFDVINRVPTDADLAPRGAGYNMVWGRNHTPASAELVSGKWDAELFVMGHQPAEMGYVIETRTMLVLASDHAHGMVLPLDTSRRYDMDKLVEQLTPLASVVL